MQTAPTGKVIAPAVGDARIFLIFSVRDQDEGNPNVKVKGIQAFLAERFHTNCVGKVRAQHPLVHEGRSLSFHIWKEVPGGMSVSPELEPSVVAALGSHGPAGKTASVTALQASSEGLNLLNGMYSRPTGDPRAWPTADAAKYRPTKKGLSLRLSKAAQRRLSTTATELLVEFREIFVVFPSDLRIIVAELEVVSSGGTPVDPIAVEEALHILTHRSRKDDCRLAAFADGDPIGVTEMLGHALSMKRFELMDSVRTFSYSAMVVNHSPSCTYLEELAFRFSRRYTTDYRLSRTEVESALYCPFESVVHAFSLEGAASVADGSDDFLASQFLSRVRQSYLWMAILAFHEQSYLLSLVEQGSANATNDATRASTLRGMISHLLDFRMKFRLPLVSQISMHNQTYERLRLALGLDDLIRKITFDVVEAERWLTQESRVKRDAVRQRMEQERERTKVRRRRLRPLEVSVSAFLMFGITFLSFDTLTNKLSKMLTGKEPGHQWELTIVLCISAVAACLRGWQVYQEIEEDPFVEDLNDAAAESGEPTEEALAMVVASGATE
ncbi:hypothetical protein [Terriglobus roseus]|uniref:Uncharacterized protein n=1 Tax=Terriglobus roseus TaxID=392734 RepID=A0A1G7NHZ3_9BACT|nr:hypothetical protein [Terriglobus roseus]SDF73586.1 hypothetical protein SAMN05444167_3151 [Terriglobus roseus]